MNEMIDCISDFGSYLFKHKYVNRLKDTYREKGEEGLSRLFMEYMDMTDVWQEFGANKWCSMGMYDGATMIMLDHYTWTRSLRKIFDNLYVSHNH